MKTIKTVLCLFLALFLIAGCGSKEDKKDDTPAEPEKVEYVAVPEEARGDYAEEVAGRATIELTGNKITLIWPESAATRSTWTMIVNYVEAEKKATYESAFRESETFDDNGDLKEYTASETMTPGYVEIGDGKLVLHDEAIATNVTTFVKIEEVVPETLVFTKDLEEAKRISGIEFAPPVDAAIPPTVVFNTYSAINGSIAAAYSNEDSSITMNVEKSVNEDQAFLDLMKTFAVQWTENYKGLRVDVAADVQDDNIHMAVFEANGYIYRITYTAPDHGLDINELGSIVMGMQ